jgi:hypothetical protein
MGDELQRNAAAGSGPRLDEELLPEWVVSWSAASRARTSAAPPGAKPLTIRTGRLGHSSARLEAGTSAAANHEATRSML